MRGGWRAMWPTWPAALPPPSSPSPGRWRRPRSSSSSGCSPYWTTWLPALTAGPTTIRPGPWGRAGPSPPLAWWPCRWPPCRRWPPATGRDPCCRSAGDRFLMYRVFQIIIINSPRYFFYNFCKPIFFQLFSLPVTHLTYKYCSSQFFYNKILF